MSVYLVRSLLLSLFIAILITVCYHLVRKDLKSGALIKFRKSPPSWSANFTMKASRRSFTEQDKAFKEAVKANLAITGERFRSAGIEPDGGLINDSTYTISVEKITDTVAVRDLLTSNTRLSFNEVYTLNDLAQTFAALPMDSFKFFSPAQAYAEHPGGSPYPPFVGTCFLQDSGKVRAFFSDTKILSRFPTDIQFLFGQEDLNSLSTPNLLIYAIRENAGVLSNKHIVRVEPTYDERNEPILRINFNSAGAIRWAKMTEKNIGKSLAMCIDGKVIFAPNVLQKIEGGYCILTTGRNMEATRILSVLLTSQELLLPASITESRFTPNGSGADVTLSNVMNYALAFFASFAISFCIIWFAFRPGKKAGASPTDP